MRNIRIKYRIVGLAASVFVVAGAAGWTARAAYKDDFKLGQNIELITNMMRGLFLYYVDPVDADKMGKNAAKGMVEGLDPYTELIHADDMEGFELMTTGKYGGIGSVIRRQGDWVLIAEPYDGSPAQRAGLEIGDAIVEIGGKSAKGMTTAQVSGLLKGEAGTTVEVTVRKLSTGENQTLTITREVIALPAVPYFGMVAEGVGYIHHSDFTDGSADELRGAFVALKAQGAKQLVLDYRGNGGGIMQEAVKIVSLFVPKGTEVVSMRGRGQGVDKTYRTEHEPVDLKIPIAVLVNGYTASASEIVTGALQDLDRAVVIGQRTFGKGLVQSTLPIGYNSFLKVTTAKYYTPSGRCIQAIDYSHQADGRTGDGAVDGAGARAVPDSLVKEFRTAGGRKVYDGGGIMPDVKLDPESGSRFAYTVYAKGYPDDFADMWWRENGATRTVDPVGFALTDADWDEFMAFMNGKQLDYKSLTGRALEALRQSAGAERYLTDDMSALLDKIQAELPTDDAALLALYRDELSTLIANDIVLRADGAAGMARHKLAADPEVAQAVATLGNAKLYREILSRRDTERK